MASAQGINKIVAYKKQVGLGTAASGSGGYTYRRRTSVFSKPIDTFENDEIVQHQQATGVSIGGSRPMGRVEGNLSPGAYSDWLGSLLRKVFGTITPITGLSLTIAGAGPTWTITRTGSWITDGYKVGHVVRLSAGTFNAANSAKNLVIVALTATVMTVRPLNGVALVAEGPIASSTVTVTGKISMAANASWTTDYYTFEEWYPEVPKSETFPDAMIAKADINVPASGNVGISFDIPALRRVKGTSQVLTSPSTQSGAANDVGTGAFGLVLVNGAVVANVTAASVSIDGATAHSDLVLGSTSADDHQRGRIRVTGQFSAMFDSTTLQDIFDAGTVTSLVLIVAEDGSAASDFIVLNIPALKLTGDAPDDGEKQIVRTYPFTAQYNAAGGSGTTSDQTIISIQDSAAA